jgi:hypothetical protein
MLKQFSPCLSQVIENIFHNGTPFPKKGGESYRSGGKAESIFSFEAREPEPIDTFLKGGKEDVEIKLCDFEAEKVSFPKNKRNCRRR